MDQPTKYKNPLIAQNSKSKEKMSMPPLIFPRSHDKDIWSYPSYKHSAINYNQSRYDLTEEYSAVPQKEDYIDYDPRLASYTGFNLNKMGDVIEDATNRGRTESCGPPKSQRESTPLFPNYPNQQSTQILTDSSTTSTPIPVEPFAPMYREFNPTSSSYDLPGRRERFQSKYKTNVGYDVPGDPFIGPLPSEQSYGGPRNFGLNAVRYGPGDGPQPLTTREGFTNQMNYGHVGRNTNNKIHSNYNGTNYLTGVRLDGTRDEGFRRQRDSRNGVVDSLNYRNSKGIEPRIEDPNFETIPEDHGEGSQIDPLSEKINVPDQSLLIPQTISSIYGKGAVTQEERIKFLTNIQPNEYSYSDVSYPINSNLGISYTPENPPRVLDQVATPNGTYPLFHRIDPQLIRDKGLPPERYEEMPRRTAWSAKYSDFEAAPGSVNIEDIYDPRFNGYGDEYRSYGDVNLGQIQYYYSDVDAYRYPNFGIRSKVDYIDYVDPMGRVLPEYDRKVGLDDIKNIVHDQYNADALYFREGLQERLMRKRNRELWQLRDMPQRKDAHAGTFTSHY